MILDLVLIGALLAIAAAVYMNGLNGEFVYDDHEILAACDKVWDPAKYLAAKPKEPKKSWVYLIEGAGPIRRCLEWMGRQHRRILYWTYFRDARIHGKADRYGWHATNIALHGLVGALLYAILRAWFSPYAAFNGSAIFLVHPMTTSAVQLIYGRASLLCGVFYLSGMIAGMIGGPAWILVPVFFAAGWLTKQEIVMLPLAIMATFYFLT